MDLALKNAVYACAALSLVCWVLSVATKDHSWVDRLWSIAPALYAVWFAAAADPLDVRLVLMAALACAWGARLTYNFARKGGYRPGGEDYRWAELRRRMSPTALAAFNPTFICAFQNGLLLLLALPVWVAFRGGPAPVGLLDAVAGLLFVGFLVGETVADQQQWAFQQDKARRLAAGETVERRFLTDGLFRYSRHPNFFCEQGLWWSMYLFSVASGADWLNLSILGPAILTALFLGSTAFTESISAGRYPEYADYQRRTSRLLPWRPAR